MVVHTKLGDLDRYLGVWRLESVDRHDHFGRYPRWAFDSSSMELFQIPFYVLIFCERDRFLCHLAVDLRMMPTQRTGRKDDFRQPLFLCTTPSMGFLRLSYPHHV